MTDVFSSKKRSAIMRAVKSNDTKPEVMVRKALHRAGFRFRLHQKNLPGKPDLVLKRFKTVIFVHGCFWHWHGCKRSRMPKTNRAFWVKKIQRNVDRDQAHQIQLLESGWRVVVIWECCLDEGLTEALEVLRNKKDQETSASHD